MVTTDRDGGQSTTMPSAPAMITCVPAKSTEVTLAGTGSDRAGAAGSRRSMIRTELSAPPAASWVPSALTARVEM